MKLGSVLLCLCVSVAACKRKLPAHTVGLALDVGGRGDQSFNDGALRGLEVMAAGLRYTAHGYEALATRKGQTRCLPTCAARVSRACPSRRRWCSRARRRRTTSPTCSCSSTRAWS